MRFDDGEKLNFNNILIRPKRSIVSTRKAFTLLELLVVIAIIGILASAVVVSLSGATEGAELAVVKKSLFEVRNIGLVSKIINKSHKGACDAGGEIANILDSLGVDLGEGCKLESDDSEFYVRSNIIGDSFYKLCIDSIDRQLVFSYTSDTGPCGNSFPISGGVPIGEPQPVLVGNVYEIVPESLGPATGAREVGYKNSVLGSLLGSDTYIDDDTATTFTRIYSYSYANGVGFGGRVEVGFFGSLEADSIDLTFNFGDTSKTITLLANAQKKIYTYNIAHSSDNTVNLFVPLTKAYAGETIQVSINPTL